MTLTPEDLTRAAQIADPSLRIREIASEVAQETGIPYAAILGPLRGHKVVSDARQLCMFIAARNGFSTAQISKAMGRDHTSVLHGVKAETKRRGMVN